MPKQFDHSFNTVYVKLELNKHEYPCLSDITLYTCYYETRKKTNSCDMFDQFANNGYDVESLSLGSNKIDWLASINQIAEYSFRSDLKELDQLMHSYNIKCKRKRSLLTGYAFDPANKEVYKIIDSKIIIK